MAGFGKTKEIIDDLENESTPIEVGKDTHSHHVEKSGDPFSDLMNEYHVLDNTPLTHLFVGIAGHENTGKTAIVTDAFVNDKKAEELNEELWIIDFEGGGAANKSAFHKNNPRIKVWEPAVTLKGEPSAIDYPATHKRVMRLLQFAVDLAQKQRTPDYKGPRIWGLHVTGVDIWDNVCVNCMRIVDLNIAKDGIEAADWNKKVGHQWDWAIRKTRFHNLTGLCRLLIKAGVRVFWETHLRLTNYSWGSSEEANAKWRPDWEKASNNFMYQILICNRKDIYDDETGEVVRSEYNVTFEKSKTNARLQGQKRTILVTETGKDPQWFGLPELYDGTL